VEKDQLFPGPPRFVGQGASGSDLWNGPRIGASLKESAVRAIGAAT